MTAAGQALALTQCVRAAEAAAQGPSTTAFCSWTAMVALHLAGAAAAGKLLPVSSLTMVVIAAVPDIVAGSTAVASCTAALQRCQSGCQVLAAAPLAPTHQ